MNIKNPFSIIWICLVCIKEMAFFSYLRTILSLTLHALHGYKFHSARHIYLEHEVLQLPVQQKIIPRLNTYTAVTEQLREKEMKKFLEIKRGTRKRNQVLSDLGKSLTEMQNSIGKVRKGKLKNFCDIDDNLACGSCSTVFFLAHFDVFFDLQLKRQTETLRLFVKYTHPVSVYNLRVSLAS